ncbi:MAG: hypothetical protein IPO13_08260 [Rhodocyclaceae bacterium]|nr:hypothetical protein [Rhodocyclaceae bacterium]
MLVLWLLVGAKGFAQSPDPTTPAAVDHLLPMEVTVNGSQGGVWLFIERAGALYAPCEAFTEWRVRTDPDPQIIRFRGQDYCPLNQIPGYRSNINFANQSVDLQFSPNAFNETRVGLKMADTLTVDPAVPSVFFNYDVNYQRSQYRDAPNLDNLGIVSEVGYSSDLGVLTSSAVTQNLTGSSQFGNQKRYLRMETT